MTPKVEKTVTVPLPPTEAFRVFTDDIALWWPMESHSLAASRGDTPNTVDMDPHLGGKVRETLPDGSTAEWATVTGWQPGHHLSLDWYVGRDPEDATQICVTFTQEPDGTRVDLVHDGFDRLGETAMATADSYRTGWSMVLGTAFARACQRVMA